jgi:hypothetical protein
MKINQGLSVIKKKNLFFVSIKQKRILYTCYDIIIFIRLALDLLV